MFNKDLLKSIDAYRHGDADLGTLEWDTLMHFFENDCIEYTLEKLRDEWLSEADAVDVANSSDAYPYYCDFLDMYLIN